VLILRPRKKYLLRKKKKKTNSKWRKDLRLATWNVRSLYRPGGLRIAINELRKYKIAIAAIQETRCNKLTPKAFTSNGYSNNHEFGTVFPVDLKFNHMVKNFTPINEHLCVIRIKCRFFSNAMLYFLLMVWPFSR
jgi:hypothetical protein